MRQFDEDGNSQNPRLGLHQGLLSHNDWKLMPARMIIGFTKIQVDVVRAGEMR